MMMTTMNKGKIKMTNKTSPEMAKIFLELFVMDEIAPLGTDLNEFLNWLIVRTDKHKNVAAGASSLRAAQAYLLKHAHTPLSKLKIEHPEYFSSLKAA